MDKLKECILAFDNLLNKEYYIRAGKKQMLLEVQLYFDKIHFHHLIGLNKLRDIRQVTRNTPNLYTDIMNGMITYNDISQSVFFDEIADRLDYFPFLERMLDSEEVIIKHNWSMAKSNVMAKAIIYSKIGDLYVHYFIDKAEHNGKFFGRTFFTRLDRLYLHDRPYKILEKRKYIDGDEVELPSS